MEDSGSTRKKTGRGYCVAGAPNKTSCKNSSNTDGISIHQFPKDLVVRKKWVKFVQTCRVDFDELCDTEYFVVLSALRRILLHAEDLS